MAQSSGAWTWLRGIASRRYRVFGAIPDGVDDRPTTVLVPNPSCVGRRYRVTSSKTMANRNFDVKRFGAIAKKTCFKNFNLDILRQSVEARASMAGSLLERPSAHA